MPNNSISETYLHSFKTVQETKRYQGQLNVNLAKIDSLGLTQMKLADTVSFL